MVNTKCISIKKVTLLFAIVLATGLISISQQLSFPTAEGAGRFVTGGRGTPTEPTTIYEVTKLTDDGSIGTLRYALTNNSPVANHRTIVFRVSGTIRLTSELKFTRANVTVAGQTAPGDGICLADYPVSFSQSNVIVRYIRFRMGDKNQLLTNPANCGIPVFPFAPGCVPINGSGDGDAFGGTYRNNIMIDHCTMSWSSDEVCSIYGGTNTTLQWNFITEPLNYNYHFETGDTDYERHGYGGIWGGTNASFHHNLFAHLQGRVPRFDGSRNLGNGATVGLENADFRNNVLYNWASYTTNGGEGGNYNIVNNYYKYGPNTSTGSSSGVSIRNMIINPYKQSSPLLPYGKYFVDGNFVENSTTITARNWLGAAMNSGSFADTNTAKVSTPFSFSPVVTHTAQNAYNLVLANGGASLPKRDTLDQRIVDNVLNRTGRIIDVQGGYPNATPFATTINAWPTLNGITAPIDTDKDGMPDIWENARGLNPNLASDRNIYNINGYTNVENYLNGDSIIAKGIANTCIASKTLVSTVSGNWLHATDTSSAMLISTDNLNVFASIRDNGNYGLLNASYFVTNTNRLLSNNSPLLNRNITITAANPNLINTPVTIRLYFSNAEYNAIVAADPTITSLSNLRVLRRSELVCQTNIIDYPEVITPSSFGVFGTYSDGYFIEFNTAELGTFFIAGSSAVLPLKLISFNAVLQNGQSKISWVTRNEINTSFFEIEKSINGVVFNKIAVIDAKGNYSLSNSYQITDSKPFEPLSYYRLKMVDKNGLFSYSPIIQVRVIGKSSISIYPNPANKTVIINHPKANNGAVLEIITPDGKLIYKQTVTKASEQTLLQIETLPLGNYILMFTNNTEKNIIQLIKN